MRLRVTASVLIAAFFVTIALSMAPDIHDAIHDVNAGHECAVTIFCGGKCDLAGADIFELTARLLVPSPVVQPRRSTVLVAQLENFLLEHAPPAHS